jgi:hypothetical protein
MQSHLITEQVGAPTVPLAVIRRSNEFEDFQFHIYLFSELAIYFYFCIIFIFCLSIVIKSVNKESF